MSASPPNIAAPPAPGPSAGASAASGAKAAAAKASAKDPAAGFEALVASFFGTEDQSDTAKAVTKDLAGTVGKTSDSGVDSAGGAAPATVESATGGDSVSADAVLALLGQPQPVAAPQVAATAPVDADPTIGGGATRAKSAAPAISLEQATTANVTLAGGRTSGSAATAAGQAATDAAAKIADTATVGGSSGKVETPPQPSAAAAPTQSPPAAPAQAPPPAPVAAQAAAPLTVAEAAAAAAVQTAAAAAASDEPKPTEGPAPVAAAPKDKAPAGKSPRADTPRIDVAAPTVARIGDAPVETVDPGPNPGAGDKDPQTADATVQPGERNTGPTDSNANTSSTITPATLTHAAVAGVRGSPQTVANLAAQIAKKLEGRSSRFDLQLDPIGLGRVDVRMEIGASGRMTAAMTFETPQAASELRARASDLQRQLEQAGFDLSGGMTFDVAGDRGQGRQAQHQDTDTGQAFRGRAFQSALATAGEAASSAQSGALNPRWRALSSVDIRI